MAESLFPAEQHKGEGIIFSISYEGPTFAGGKMNIADLSAQLEGFQGLVDSIIERAVKEKKLPSELLFIPVYVESFREGSFKYLLKWTDKHPGATALIGSVASTIIGVILTRGPMEVRLLSDPVIQDLNNPFLVNVLSTPRFRQSLANTVTPLEIQGDVLKLYAPAENRNIEIPRSEKEKVLGISENQDDVLYERDVLETLKGKIISVNLDATKNQAGFKVEDRGSMIDCTFFDNISREQLKELLDSWVEITGTTTKVGEERKRIMVTKFIIVGEPGQISINWGEKQ